MEYSDEQRRILRDQFQPVAERFRKSRARLGWYFVAGFLSGLLIGTTAEYLFPALPSP